MKYRNFILTIFVFLLVVGNAAALGITPGRTTINYENGLEQDVAFSILNNEHNNAQVVLTLQGELADSITLYESIINFEPSDDARQLKYRVKLPNSIALEPGLHSAEIVAMELPKKNADGTYVGATIAVVSQLHVYVACPGKCIEYDLSVLDAEENGTATFIIPVLNRGELGIGSIRAVIDIYNLDYDKKATITTDTREITAGGRTELSAKWDVDVNPGNYLAKVSIFYDGETENFEKHFTVGKNVLSIESILVNNFKLGQIAKLQILVENKFNQDLEDVFANLLVYNKNDQVMADIRSASEPIPSQSKKELIAYWDTVGVKKGEYDGKILVKYNGKSADKNLLLKISQNELAIFGIGYAISSGVGEGIDITAILIALVAILLLANISWFIFFRKFIRKSDKYNKFRKDKKKLLENIKLK